MHRQTLMEIYERLIARFGPQHWWPGQTTLEIIVGAILTQNTSWSNVEKAIANLRTAGLLDAEKLYQTPPDALAELIRPAGYFNVKTKRLRAFLTYLVEKYGGNLEKIGSLGKDHLREEFLGISGIGPETADSICLYAFAKPQFVIDAYTARILGRHRLIEPGADYDQIKWLFESALPQDVAIYNEYHALLVRLGKDYCRPKPQCEGCPLNDMPHITEPQAY